MAATTQKGRKSTPKKSMKKTVKKSAPKKQPTGKQPEVVGGTKAKPYMAMVPTAQVSIEPGFNPRKNRGSIDELEMSIKKDGLAHNLVVRPVKGEADAYRVICGERRLAALQKLGWKSVPVQIRKDLIDDDYAAKALAGAENSGEARADLTDTEIGELAVELREKGGYSVKRVADATGYSPQRIRRTMDLVVKGDKDILKLVDDELVSTGAALEHAKLSGKARKEAKEALLADPSIGRDEVKRIGARAARSTAGPATAKASKRETGESRDRNLTIWRLPSTKTARLRELCHDLNSVPKADRPQGDQPGTPDYYGMVGVVSALLWDRGLREDALPPCDPVEAKSADQKAEIKTFWAQVEELASQHKVADAE
jgi:ParB/RepB/Spo0J family partition protein